MYVLSVPSGEALREMLYPPDSIFVPRIDNKRIRGEERKESGENWKIDDCGLMIADC
jgi:hypothetical protein